MELIPVGLPNTVDGHYQIDFEAPRWERGEF